MPKFPKTDSDLAESIGTLDVNVIASLAILAAILSKYPVEKTEAEAAIDELLPYHNRQLDKEKSRKLAKRLVAQLGGWAPSP